MSQIVQKNDISYRNLFKTMAQGVVYQNAEGQIISVNKSAEKILGLTFDQMTGRTSTDPRWKAIHEDGSDFSGETHPAMVALKTGKPVKDVLMGVLNSDEEEYRWININAVPEYRGDDRKPYQVYTIFEDITEHKRVDDEVRLQSEITANMYEGIYLISVKDLVIFYATPRFEEMFGYDSGEIIGKEVSIVNAPTEMTPRETVDYITGIIKETGSWQGEIQNIKKNGTPFYCYASASMFDHPKHGEIIISVHTDITDRKQAESMLQQLGDNLPNGAVYRLVHDVNGHRYFDYASSGFERMFGLKTVDLMNDATSLYELSYPDDIEKVVAIESRAVEMLEAFNYEGRLILKNGEIRWYKWHSQPMRLGDGTIIFDGVCLDITNQKQIEKEREKLIHELQEALKEIETLRGILPLCSFCKKIRNDKGYWEQVDVYIYKHLGSDISHSICPECMKKHYLEYE